MYLNLTNANFTGGSSQWRHNSFGEGADFGIFQFEVIDPLK
jgi:hypothetical protein